MISGRGRGTRRGGVTIKVDNPDHNKDAADDGVYEDDVVYVTERSRRAGAPRKRGRPRKPVAVVPTMTPRQAPVARRYSRSTVPGTVPREVIYVSSAWARPQYVITSRSHVIAPVAHQTPRNTIPHDTRIVPSAGIKPQTVRCLVHGANPLGQTSVKPVLAVGALRVCSESKEIIWPEDLRDIVDRWDSLPERETREVVKWLSTPLYGSKPPKIVSDIHESWASIPDPWETKIDMTLEWLQIRKASTTAPLPMTNRAKVVVEAQPTPIQECGQWSSMADNRENYKP